MTELSAAAPPSAAGTKPFMNMPLICAAVKLPRPVALSGVRLREGRTSPFGNWTKVLLPARYLVMSGAPEDVLGVWQSEQAITLSTRYLPRAASVSGKPDSGELAQATTVTETNNASSTLPGDRTMMFFILVALLRSAWMPSGEALIRTFCAGRQWLRAIYPAVRQRIPCDVGRKASIRLAIGRGWSCF